MCTISPSTASRQAGQIDAGDSDDLRPSWISLTEGFAAGPLIPVTGSAPFLTVSRSGSGLLAAGGSADAPLLIIDPGIRPRILDTVAPGSLSGCESGFSATRGDGSVLTLRCGRTLYVRPEA